MEYLKRSLTELLKLIWQELTRKLTKEEEADMDAEEYNEL